MKKRLTYIDCTRALCMLWIVGFWHLKGYFLYPIDVTDSFSPNVTVGVLGTFTFLSALFLGKHEINGRKDIGKFLNRRLIRVYPLFIISAVSLYLIHLVYKIDYISSGVQFVLTILGLSSLLTCEPQTVWYISMLLLFYFITPFLNYIKNMRVKVFAMIGVITALIILNVFGTVSNNILLYFPVFCFGLIYTRMFDDVSEKSNYILGALCLICFLVFSLLKQKTEMFILNYPIMMAFIVVCLELGKILSKWKITETILKLVSFSSMAAYLFHRQFFGALEILLGKFGIWFAYCIALPLLIVVAFFIQKTYDYIVGKITKRVEG